MPNDLKPTQLPALEIPDLEKSLAAHPEETCAIQGVGFLHYHPDSATGFLFLEAERTWLVTQPITRAAMIHRATRMANAALVDEARKANQRH